MAVVFLRQDCLERSQCTVYVISGRKGTSLWRLLAWNQCVRKTLNVICASLQAAIFFQPTEMNPVCGVGWAMWLRQCKVYGPDNDEYRRDYCDGRQHFRKSWWWFSPLIGTVLKYSKRDLTELFSFELRTTVKGNEHSCTFSSCVLCVINKLTVMKQKILSSCIWGKRRGRQRGNSLFSKNCLRLIHWDR